MPANPSLSNAITALETKLFNNLPAGMTFEDVEWAGAVGLNPDGRAKWARSSYTELDTVQSASGWSRTTALYTVQLFYQVPTQGSVRTAKADDMDALKAVFRVQNFESVSIIKCSSSDLGKEAGGIWDNQNLIVTFTIEGEI